MFNLARSPRLGIEAFDAAPSRPMVRAVIAACIAVGILFLVAFPFRSVVIGRVPGFYVVYGTILVACDALTSLLFGWWAARAGDGRVAILSGTFAFSAVILLAGVVSVEASLGVASSAWLLVIWNIACPTGILLSTSPWARKVRLAPVLLTAGGLAVAAAAVSFSLGPRVVQLVDAAGRFTGVYVAAILAAVITATALWRLLRSARPPALNLILAFGLFALLAGIVLALSSSVLFSVGTYGARIFGMLSGFGVALTLSRWVVDLMNRSEGLSHYIAVAETAPTIMFLTDPLGRCSYVNGRWPDLTGQTVDQALGLGWHACIHPDDMSRIRYGPEQTYEAELRYRDQAGNYRWHLVRYARLTNRRGELVGWVGTATDQEAQRRALDESQRLSAQMRARYEHEREISSALRGAFQQRFLPNVAGLRFNSVYRPAPSATDVGGDWFDGFVLSNGLVAFSMGDVSGHGLEAAAAMLGIREALRMAALAIEGSPGEALSRANRSLALHGDVFATALLVFIDVGTGRMTTALAGHPAPVLISAGAVTPLISSGLVLGAVEHAVFAERETWLQPGDRVAFYTDGLIENDMQPIAGEQHLFDALRVVRETELDRLVDTALDGAQLDDATLVLMSYQGVAPATSWHFQSDDAASASTARASFCDHLRRRGLAVDFVERAELVFGELVGNVVRHAPGPIEIDLSFDGSDARLAVRDRGPGFTPGAMELPADLYEEAGRGFYLVRSLAGFVPVVVERSGGGVEVVVAIVAGAQRVREGAAQPAGSGAGRV